MRGIDRVRGRDREREGEIERGLLGFYYYREYIHIYLILAGQEKWIMMKEKDFVRFNFS